MHIAYIVNHHYPATVLFCKQKLLYCLLITHDHPLRKHCISSDPLTLPQGKINWCQTWLGNTQGVRFSQLALCIPRSSADIFTHSILEKYLGATRRPLYNGVSVIMESQCTSKPGIDLHSGNL